MVCTARWESFDIIFWKPLNMSWKDTMFVNSSSYADEMQATFKEGDPIYFYYTCYEADGQTIRTSFVNRFKLTGDNGVSEDLYQNISGIYSGTCEGVYGEKVDAFQNLTPGTYTLTCTLDADGNVLESDEGNNTQSITFTVAEQIAPKHRVTLRVNDGTANGSSYEIEEGTLVGDLPVPERAGFVFRGWYTAANGGTKIADSVAVTGDVTYYAHWVAEGAVEYALHDSPVYGGLSSAYKGGTFNGYAVDGDGLIAGTFSLAVKKPAKGKTTAAATLTFVSLATGKKTKITGTVNLATGAGSGGLTGLTLGANAVGGTVSKVGTLEGGADAAKAKNAAALSVLSKFSGKSYVVALGPGNPDVYAQGGCSTLAVTLAAKGKAKVSGVLADGTKVTASGVMTVGDTYCCVPVIYSKKSRFGFVAWFNKNTRQLVDVTALTPWRNTVKPAFTMAWEVLALGAKGNVAAGTRTVELDGAKLRGLVPGAVANTPTAIPLTVKGTVWNAGKAAKVSLKGGILVINGSNLSGLKLTYTAKTGLFKGSFTAYAVKGGKLVKSKFSVFGAVTGGVGYGTAVLKGKGSAAVYVE